MESKALLVGLLSGGFALGGVSLAAALEAWRSRVASNRERVDELRDVLDAGAVALGEALHALGAIHDGMRSDEAEFVAGDDGSQAIDDFGRQVASARTIQHRLRVRLGRQDPLWKSYARPSNGLTNIHTRLYAASNRREPYSVELLEREAGEVRNAREAFFTAAAEQVGPKLK